MYLAVSGQSSDGDLVGLLCIRRADLHFAVSTEGPDLIIILTMNRKKISILRGKKDEKLNAVENSAFYFFQCL